MTRLLILLVLAFLFGVVFYDLDTSDIAGVNSLNGFAFVGPTFSAVIFMLTSVPVVARERAVFYRERLSNTYVRVFESWMLYRFASFEPWLRSLPVAVHVAHAFSGTLLSPIPRPCFSPSSPS